jgi:acyl carrier protein
LAPRTATEQRIAAIWAQVFGVERVGLLDDFLTCGGHSLLAARINARVSKAFQIELSIGSVLDASTVADYARHVDVLLARAADAPGTSVGLCPSDVARRRARGATPQSSANGGRSVERV